MAQWLCYLFVFLSLFYVVDGDSYCSIGRCHSNQYCCGSQRCCRIHHFWELWYFWFSVAVFLLIIISCCTVVRRKQYLRRRSDDVIVYSAPASNTVRHNITCGHEIMYMPSENTHYYMAPATSASSPGSLIYTPVVGQGQPQAFVYPTYVRAPSTFASAPPFERHF